MSNRAWVTLATNDSYGLGALVLAHSLRRVNSAYPAVILVTPSVTEAMRNRLNAVFAEVITVDVLDSRDAAHLALLQRPELGITFTKIHCWTLTQYEKCVFLDADTLIVQNCDELFEREELSAAPDVGWPDCFNSGVFVFVPSNETYSRLITFAQERGSFDGGDQGLLNAFFADWARGDISKHLPFLYNVTSAAFYSYMPALKHYGQDLKIIHFIGAAKPWLQQFNWESRTVDAPEHLRQFLQIWWDLFVGQVHSNLDATMETRVEVEDVPPETPLPENLPEDTHQHYEPEIDPESEFPWHRPEAQTQQTEMQAPQIDMFNIFDPWQYYRGHIPAKKDLTPSQYSDFPSVQNEEEIRKYAWEYQSPQSFTSPHVQESKEQNKWQHQPQYNEQIHQHQKHHQAHQHEHYQPHQPEHHQSDHHEHHHSHQHEHHQPHHHQQHQEHYQPHQDNHQHGHQHGDNQSHKISYDKYQSETQHQSRDHDKWHQHEQQIHYHDRGYSEHNTDHTLYPHHHSTHSHHPQSTTQSHDQLFHQDHKHDHQSQNYPDQFDPLHQTEPIPDNHSLKNSEHRSVHQHGSNKPVNPYDAYLTTLQVYHVHLDHRRRTRRRLKQNHVCSKQMNGDLSDTDSEEEFIIPRHPYDGFYLRHKTTIDSRGRKICTHEIPLIPPSPSPPPSPDPLSRGSSSPTPTEEFATASECEDLDSGVAGNLARVTAGAGGGYQREAIDELTRRQGWEAGNIDYMGADSFANIWAKISQTLSAPRSSPPKQPSPPKEPPQPEAASAPEAPAPEAPAPAASEAPTSAPEVSAPEVPTPVPEVPAPEVPAPEVLTPEAPAPEAPAPAPTPAPVESPKAAAPVETTPSVVPKSAPEVPKTKPAPAAPQTEAPKEEAKKTEPTVPPTPPATPKSPSEASTPVTESAPKIEAEVKTQSAPEAAKAPEVVPQAPKVAEPVAPRSPAVAAKAPVATPGPVTTPVKAQDPSAATAASTDSPPLANTPSKEEAPTAPIAPVAPAAKSEERKKPAGKLQLSPPAAADAAPTPDSELEDAAALAHSIIASELSPAPAPPTPPVSLAQIGVKSKEKPTTAAQIASSITSKAAAPVPKSPASAEPSLPATPKPSAPTPPASPSPAEPSSPAPSDAPKKKIVKKVVKKEAAPSGDAATPVPPPRKKEKKPKEK